MGSLKGIRGRKDSSSVQVETEIQVVFACLLVWKRGGGRVGGFDQRDKKTQEIRQKGAVIFNYLKNIPEVIAVCVLIIYCFGRRSSTWRI